MFITFQLSRWACPDHLVQYITSTANVFMWFFVAGQFGFFCATGQYYFWQRICFCLAAYMYDKNLVMIPSFVSIAVNLSTISLGWLIYRKNKVILANFTIPASNVNVLSWRHKTWENIQTTKWLIPLALLNAVTVVGAIILRNSALIFMEATENNFILIAMVTNLLFSIETVLYPIACIR